jgi:hypothetical protein
MQGYIIYRFVMPVYLRNLVHKLSRERNLFIGPTPENPGGSSAVSNKKLKEIYRESYKFKKYSFGLGLSFCFGGMYPRRRVFYHPFVFDRDRANSH